MSSDSTPDWPSSVTSPPADSSWQQVTASCPVPVWVWGSLCAVASGALLSACYWPLRAHGLAWIALVPWLAVLPRLSSAWVWLLGTVVGLVFYRFTLGWLFDIHGMLAGATIVVLSFWLGIAFCAIRMVVGRLSTAAMLWAAPLMLAGQEVLRCEGLPRLRFPFAAWGYSQSHSVPVAQIASIGGVYLLTFLLVLVNAGIAYAVIHRRLRACAPAFASIVLVVLLGIVTRPSGFAAESAVAAACVQSETSSYREYLDLTRTALEHPARPKLVVLPEHTISDYAHRQHPFVVALGRLAREHQAYICVGAHTPAPTGAECDYLNVAMLIGPDGTIVKEQAKWVPLPFFADGHPGRTQSVTQSEYGKIGMYVCYDGLFTDVPRRVANLGAQILLVPNMDPARWPAQERWQHADMAPLRCIELRRCAIRANSAGISQIIDASGRIVAQRTDEQGAGTLVAAVYSVCRHTPFVRGGYLFAPAMGITYLGMLVVLAATYGRQFGALGVPAPLMQPRND